MPGFKYASGNRRRALCARMGCSRDAVTTVVVRGVTYCVCKLHKKGR